MRGGEEWIKTDLLEHTILKALLREMDLLHKALCFALYQSLSEYSVW